MRLGAGFNEPLGKLGWRASGSICVCIDHDYAGFVSLLCRFHVAVLPAENIVERPADLFRPDRLNGDGLRRNFVFITGPSATADMGPLTAPACWWPPERHVTNNSPRALKRQVFYPTELLAALLPQFDR